MNYYIKFTDPTDPNWFTIYETTPDLEYERLIVSTVATDKIGEWKPAAFFTDDRYLIFHDDLTLDILTHDEVILEAI
jgi:hypothetical protein